MTTQLTDRARPEVTQPLAFGNGGDADVERWIPIAALASSSGSSGGMLMDSEPARRVTAAVARIAPYKTAVLVHGESGVGKELVSRAIHRNGPCPNGPFVTFNCSNLVESLAESQLFGHVKGAFTDAREESLGYFRSANGGTLFLDEIGELPLKLQPKLLRAVETHEVQAVGSSQTHKVEIRLVCATNRDLKAMVREGSFRADLYYRLNAAAITIPPLRERRSEIGALVAHFVELHGRAFNKSIRYIARDALDTLRAFEWPGNVRQLSHAIESALMMTDTDRITFADLPDTVAHKDAAPLADQAATEVDAPAETPGAMQSLDSAIERAAKDALTQALRASSGNCVRAAELLGVSRYTVYRMINRYGISSLKGRRILTSLPSVARM